jgi:hypothetical protein
MSASLDELTLQLSFIEPRQLVSATQSCIHYFSWILSSTTPLSEIENRVRGRYIRSCNTFKANPIQDDVQWLISHLVHLLDGSQTPGSAHESSPVQFSDDEAKLALGEDLISQL